MKRVSATCRFAAVLAIFLCCAPAVFAGPPARPMVISGEVLVDGKPAPEGSVLRFMIGQGEGESKVVASEEGISYVRVVIPALDLDRKEIPGGREGDLVKFVGVGPYLLGDMPPVKWKPGQNLRTDFLVNSRLKRRPVIISASAVSDGEKWSLKCTVDPVALKEEEPAPASYRVRWFRIPEKAVDGKQQVSVLIKEEALTNVGPDTQSVLDHASNGTIIHSFRVILTPVLSDGSVGPSAIRDVAPVVNNGEI